jgi:hypothetical protein
VTAPRPRVHYAPTLEDGALSNRVLCGLRGARILAEGSFHTDRVTCCSCRAQLQRRPARHAIDEARRLGAKAKTEGPCS